ncbi:MAG TPA: hypothetical protein VF787_17905 [Thermoanaerobaculia bacterium]
MIPVAGRVSGIAGSAWRTDVVITNVATSGDPVDVGIMIPGFTTTFLYVHLGPGQTLTTRDVLKTWGNAESGLSYIRLASAREDARLVAHARIYNGSYGQIVHALPVQGLGRTALLTGISEGDRANIGFVAIDARGDTVALTLLRANGIPRATKTIALDRAFMQLNDVYALFGATRVDGDSVRIEAPGRIAAYASIVHDATGDADLIHGASTDIPSNEVIAPGCAEPAPLALSEFPASGFLVLFDDDADATVRAPQLAAKYGFELLNVWTDALEGFYADLTPQMIAGIRCEADVKLVEENSVGFLAGQ